MTLIYLVLLVAAFLCFLVAAFGDRTGEATTLTRGRLRFLALGLALWVLVPLIQTLRAL